MGRIERFEEHQRAFLEDWDGRDAFCAYCIIPQLRPNLIDCTRLSHGPKVS